MKKIITGMFVTMTCATLLFAQPRPPVPAINLGYLRIDFIHPSARPASLGGAFIAAAQDESAAPINPAGLTFLKSAGATLNQRHVRSKYDEPEGSPLNPNARTRFDTIHFDQTMVGAFLPLNRVTLAFFRHVAFDSRFNFETQQFLTTTGPPSQRQALGGLGNLPGKRVNLDLEMVNDSFSIAIRLSRRLSIGFTGKTSVLNFRIDEFTFLDPLVAAGLQPRSNRAETTYSILTLDERNVKPAYSFGMLGKVLMDQLFWGAVVDLNPTFILESNIFLPEYRQGETAFPAESDLKAFRINVPDRYGFGLYYVATPRLRFSLDLVRVEYTDLLNSNNLNAVEDDIFDESSSEYVDPDGRSDLTVEDATEFHIGMEYLFRVPSFGLIPLRFGFYTNPDHRIHAANSTPDLRRLFPRGEDRVHLAFGLGAILNSYLKFDFGLNWSEDNLELFGSTLVSIPF